MSKFESVLMLSVSFAKKTIQKKTLIFPHFLYIQVKAVYTQLIYFH